MKLIAQKIRKTYLSGAALNCFSYSFLPGVSVLLGPGGCGKSVLLQILSGELSPESGAVFFENEKGVCRETVKWGARYRKQLGFMPQADEPLPTFTVRQLLDHMATLRGLWGGKKRKKVAELLSVLLPEEPGDRPVRELSGGLRRRLSLAAALIGDPPILLLDEPLAGLDHFRKTEVARYLRSVSAGKVVVIASQYPDDADLLADSVLFLREGELLSASPRAEWTGELSGRVWLLTADEEEAASCRERFLVTEEGRMMGRCLLRVIADAEPTPGASPADPSLSDAYALAFAKEKA